MGIGLVQLVAFGTEDLYLTGQPQISFFKSVYRRHTNFSMESIPQTITGTVSPGSRVSVTIARNGDLLKKLWITFNPSNLFHTDVTDSSANKFVVHSDLGHSLFNIIELEIGGQVIDSHYGKWLTIWRDLTEVNPTGHQSFMGPWGGEPPLNNFDNSVVRFSYLPNFNKSTRYQRMSYTHGSQEIILLPEGNNVSILGNAPTEAYVPMQFWFCKNPGLALPLIAMQYHEVKINITFNKVIDLVSGFSINDYIDNSVVISADYSSIQVFGDYIFLDSAERKQFADNPHEYLIEQVQFQKIVGNNNKLYFNHPIKEILWTGSSIASERTKLVPSKTSRPYAGYGTSTPQPIVPRGDFLPPGSIYRPSSLTQYNGKLVFNGNDRFSARHLNYFTRNQIWNNHTGFGSSILNPDCIAVYSFSLRPEEHQPSGTCNFSRINEIVLTFGTISNTDSSLLDYLNLDIFAVNYNILRISAGMGTIAYSN